MKKRLIALFLAVLLLAGCQSAVAPNETEQAITYDWMAGESMVFQQRFGVKRFFLKTADHEVTPNGVYFIYRPMDSLVGPFILYMENGSDSIIKLCGRADCTHETEECDAYLERGTEIAYHDGYLYAMMGEFGRARLIRMDLDGTNRVEVYDASKAAKELGYSTVSNSEITNGYVYFGMTKFDDSGSQSVWDYRYCLDGPVDQELYSGVAGHWLSYCCGDTFIYFIPPEYESVAPNGGAYGSFWSLDIETDTYTYLADGPGVPAVFDEEKGLYFKDGIIWMRSCETQEDTVLLDTGLEGDYNPYFFPDCIALASDHAGDDNLHVYNWDFQLVDSIPIDFLRDGETRHLKIIAETAERFILAQDGADFPRYYIEKSELGTPDAEVHEFLFPDLPEEPGKFDEEYGIINDDNW